MLKKLKIGVAAIAFLAGAALLIEGLLSKGLHLQTTLDRIPDARFGYAMCGCFGGALLLFGYLLVMRPESKVTTPTAAQQPEEAPATITDTKGENHAQ